MAAPSITYVFSNGTTADAGQVNTNFTDIIDALTDASADLDIGSLAVTNAVTLDAQTASRVLTVNGSKVVTSSAVTTTELALLSGATVSPVGKMVRTLFTASGTWTKATLNPKFVVVTVIGGGGGGGGSGATGGSESAHAGCGGGGETGYKVILSADLGTTETVTVGTGGAGASAGSGDGNTGVTSSFGSHVTAIGGSGGTGMAGNSGSAIVSGGVGGTGGTGGTLYIRGGDGDNGRVMGGIGVFVGKSGGTVLGQGRKVGATSAGNAGYGYGSGGTGATAGNSTSARAGGAGADGIVIVDEYIG